MHNCSYNYSNWMNTCLCVCTIDKMVCYSLKPMIIYISWICDIKLKRLTCEYYILLVWFWIESRGNWNAGTKFGQWHWIKKDESGCILLCSTESPKIYDGNKRTVDLNISQTHITLTSIKYLTASFYRCCCIHHCPSLHLYIQ